MKSAMPANFIVGLLLLLQLAACATTKAPAPVAAAPQPVAATPPPAPVSAPTPAPVVTTPPPAPAATPTVAAPATVPETKPAASPPVKAVTPARPPTAATAQRTPVTAPPPPMALATLEQRLKDTDAIGVFTKIALKNQVDDLLNRAKAHHQGNGNSTLAQLRQSYDQLLTKVHGLLKDGDPALANAIIASREAIWIVIMDPVKFATL